MPSPKQYRPAKVIPVANEGVGYELRGDNRALISAPEHEVILSGPSDTGKTVASLIKAHLICSLCPGAQGAITRKTYASMRGSVLQTYNRIIKGQGVVA